MTKNGEMYEDYGPITAEFEDDEGYGEFDDEESYEFDDDEGIAAEFDDDEGYGEFDDDEGYGEFDDDEGITAEYEEGADAEFLGTIAGLAAPLIGKGIGGAIKGISRLVKGKRGRRRKLPSSRYRRGGVRVGHVRGIRRRSKLKGRLRTRSGRNIPFRLPGNIATKSDIAQLRRSIHINASAIKKVTKGVKANANSIIRTSRMISSIDKKHSTATQAQNRVMNALNKRVLQLKKDQDAIKQQSQTQLLLSMFMQPELKEVTLKNNNDANADLNTGDDQQNKFTVESASFEDNNLPLILAMSGGFGGSGGGLSNPLVLLALTGSL